MWTWMMPGRNPGCKRNHNDDTYEIGVKPKEMVKRKEGGIINISSKAGIAYNATKHALVVSLLLARLSFWAVHARHSVRSYHKH
jgi:hypothetical protein